MINCINCQHVIEIDKYGNIHQCEYANENVKECVYFNNPNKKIPKEVKNNVCR